MKRRSPIPSRPGFRGPTRPWARVLLLLLALSGAGSVLAENPTVEDLTVEDLGAEDPTVENPTAEDLPAADLPAEEPRAAVELVTAIEVRATGRLDPSLDLGELLALRIGDPLSREAVRETLARCHATGLFSRVELYSRSAPADSTSIRAGGSSMGGVEAILVLIGHVRVDRVVFVGETKLRTRRLRRHLRQGANGAILDPAAVRASEEALTRELHRRGYPEARVRIEERALPRDRWVDLVVHFETGPQARLGQIRVSNLALESASIDGAEGEEGRSPGPPPGFRGLDPLGELRSATGDPYDPEKLDADRQRLRRFLARSGFLAARVLEPRTQWQPETTSMHVVFPVALGPRFELEIRGEERRRLERKGFLPFYGDRPFDETFFDQTCARLREHLQAKGHFRATVNCRVVSLVDADRGSDADRRLEIEIDPGAVYRLTEIDTSGAESVPRGELRELLQSRPKERFAPGSGRLVSRELDEDLENLRSFYLLQGFVDVEISGARITETEPVAADPMAEKELRVEIPITEGRRQRVVKVEFRNGDTEETARFSTDELRSRLPLAAGSGFHPLLLEDSLNVLRTLYEEEGYPQAAIAAELDWNDEETLVEVIFTIEQGPRRELDRLVLRGLHRTRAEVVKRHARLESGEAPSRRDLLRAERDLYRLGIFSEVDVSFLPSALGTSKSDVLIEVEEGRPWRVAYGVSYHSDDGLGGLFGLTRLNLGGVGDRLQLDLRTSENDQRLRFIYDRPSLGRLPLPITYSVFLRDELRPSYRVNESGLRVRLTRDFERLRLGLLYDYRLVELEEEPLDPADLEREDSAVEISSLTPTLFLDRRDDPLDPRSGWSTAVQVEWAFPSFSADTSFTKLFWQQTQYLPLGDWGTLAGSFRIGAIEPGGSDLPDDPILSPDLPSAGVPISERFFAGGRTTHRAYERDSLGIPGESLIERPDGSLLEVGGNGLFLVNLDYRFPISGALEGVVFTDVGQVWADWRDFDPDELRWGAGFGVRYASPVGPIRLEVGWKVAPKSFEDDDPIFLLSFGNPF